MVMMESVRALESGAYGAEPSITPELDKLAGDGMLFKNFYANGSQTARGELALLCSFYPNPTDAVTYRIKPEVKMSSLPGILTQRGYATLWISGFRKEYQNKYGFLSKHGVNEFHDQKGMPPDTPRIGWGPSDEEIFKYAESILDRQAEPFFAEITTLSNHWDFQSDYPTASQTPKFIGSKEYVGYTRGVYYTDWAVGRFMERMRAKPYFENTIFVFVSDHSIWLFPSDPELESVQKQEAYFRMPLIIYAPELIEPAVVEAVGSQVDFAPTMLHLLGVRERNAFVGRSLLAEESESERYALMHLVRLWNLRVGNRYIYDVGVDNIRPGYPHHTLMGSGYEKNTTHAYFETDADLLRVWDPDSVTFGPNDERIRHEEWVEDLIGFNKFFIREDRLFDWPYLSVAD
jgi:phosphoglycerol transferase MdoB-like AlkP superfamily enzyme